MPEKFIPREPQILAIQHMFDNPRCAVWADMGVGKTGACLYMIYILKLMGIGPALVLGPLRVANTVWSDECAKWDIFSSLKVSAITGKKEKREKALATEADIHTVNYKNIPWLIDQFNMKAWPWPIIIADESTRLKSFRLNKGSVRAKSLSRIAFKQVKYFIELTGTPVPNGYLDLWGQLYFIDKGERLGRTYTGFSYRWFRLPHRNAHKAVAMDHSIKEIDARVKDVCLAIRAKDYFDLDDIVESEVKVYLPPVAKKHYKEMEKKLYTKILNNEIEAFSAGTSSMKCLQMASGAVYHDNNEWCPLHDAKLEALESIVTELNGAPLLVVYHFKTDLERLQKHFPKAKTLTEANIKKWNKGEIEIALIHPQSSGHGLNLQHGGHHMAFFGHWWDTELRDQVIARIGPVRQAQAGYKRNVFLYNIVAQDTVDQLVMQKHRGIGTIQDLLLDAARKDSKIDV